MTTTSDAVPRATPDRWMQWLDQEADGELTAAERRGLDRALADDPARETERLAMSRLHQLLTSPEAAPSIEVSPDFVACVMARLPEAPWQAEQHSAKQAGLVGLVAWQLPLAAMLAFATLAAFLLAGIDNAILGTGGAVLDFLATTALAGAGLLEASWRGVGWGLQDIFTHSPGTVAAMAGLVVGLDILFVSLLLRRKSRLATEACADSEDA